MADQEMLDPSRTALLVFDMLERFRHRVEKAGTLPPVRRLIEACRAAGVPIFFARGDLRTDGSDLARALTDVDAEHRPWSDENQRPTCPDHPQESPANQVLPEIAPQPGDHEICKKRWNAFHQTHLDLSLRANGIDTILLVGGSTHVGIASTMYGARDLDYHVVVVREGCHGHEAQRRFLLDEVFPRACRVRSLEDVLGMLDVPDVGAVSAEG